MQTHLNYNSSALKKAVNVTANSDLVRIAKEHSVNLSETFEEALLAKLKIRLQQEWLDENKEGIEAYNERIDRNGIFAEKHRSF